MTTLLLFSSIPVLSCLSGVSCARADGPPMTGDWRCLRDRATPKRASRADDSLNRSLGRLRGDPCSAARACCRSQSSRPWRRDESRAWNDLERGRQPQGLVAPRADRSAVERRAPAQLRPAERQRPPICSIPGRRGWFAPCASRLRFTRPLASASRRGAITSADERLSSGGGIPGRQQVFPCRSPAFLPHGRHASHSPDYAPSFCAGKSRIDRASRRRAEFHWDSIPPAAARVTLNCVRPTRAEGGTQAGPGFVRLLGQGIVSRRRNLWALIPVAWRASDGTAAMHAQAAVSPHCGAARRCALLYA